MSDKEKKVNKLDDVQPKKYEKPSDKVRQKIDEHRQQDDKNEKKTEPNQRGSSLFRY